MRRVLIVDDEVDMLAVCRDILEDEPGLEVHTESRPKLALQQLSGQDYDLIVVDLKMPEVGGLALMEQARKLQPDADFIVFTAFPTIETAVQAMKVGAADYIPKPFSPDHFRTVITRVLEQKEQREERRLLSAQLEGSHMFDSIVGQSEEMRRVYMLIERVAPVSAEVLITGPSGSGKELVARSIHRRSTRASQRFVPVDCGAVPENLLESEFFGFTRGAFSGADRAAMGLFEYAHQGTLFLDEVCELSLTMQAKLLRALQERSIRRIGARREIGVDIRVLAATNRDIQAEVAAGRFREDLYFRLNVVRIEVPPLCERLGDVELLTAHFLSRYAGEYQVAVPGVSADAHEVLTLYSWPGNVRELQNLTKQLVLFGSGECVEAWDLPDELIERAGRSDRKDVEGFFDLREKSTAEFELGYLTNLMEKHRGSVASALVEAKLPRATFYRLLKKHGLQSSDFQ